MASRRWVSALRGAEGAEEDYRAHLEAILAECQRRVDEAPTWEAVMEARGAKKEIDKLLKGLNMQAREERAYAEFRRVTRSA